MKEWLLLIVFSILIYGVQLSKVESQTYVYKSIEKSFQKLTDVTTLGSAAMIK
ncbi:MAG: hypothetical protein HN576_13715 [Bacteriovoracaceae bacterium]|nr:hypothetical protein [Bacteriovoracaceae bacterium]